MLLLDIALDNYFRLCIERTDKNNLSGDDLLDMVGMVLSNACIAGESQDFGQVCLSHTALHIVLPFVNPTVLACLPVDFEIAPCVLSQTCMPAIDLYIATRSTAPALPSCTLFMHLCRGASSITICLDIYLISICAR